MRLIDADNFLKQYLDQIPGDTIDAIDLRLALLKEPKVEAIPIEWLKNKRDELEKEYYDLFHTYIDEGKTKQLLVLNDFHAFSTVLKYWEERQ